MSEPIQAPLPESQPGGPRDPKRGGLGLSVLKIVLLVGAVLFLQHVVLPRLGIFT